MNKGDLHIGERYVQRSTGLRVKVVEIVTVLKKSHYENRYRMNGSTAYLTARQVRALYDALTTTPAAATQARRA